MMIQMITEWGSESARACQDQQNRKVPTLSLGRSTTFNIPNVAVLQVHLDVISLIIDIVGETKDTNLLEELALVSHSFLQICRKHPFATVELHNTNDCLATSKKGFVKLLNSRLYVVKYIRKLTYGVSDDYDDDDRLLSPILSNFLPTISRLNCPTITTSHRDWNTQDSSLTSTFLYLMRFPTINHIDLSSITNFPMSSLTVCQPASTRFRASEFQVFRST